MNHTTAIAAKRAELAKLRVQRDLRAALRSNVVLFQSVEPQPVLVTRAEAKALPRRFTGEPPSIFGAFAS